MNIERTKGDSEDDNMSILKSRGLYNNSGGFKGVQHKGKTYCNKKF